MKYEERICRKQGNYIVSSSIEFEELLIKEALQIEQLIIEPGELTTLHGLFTVPCKYVGMLQSEGKSKKAIFYLGQGSGDLFGNGGYYYDLTYILEPNRIGKKYTQTSFRDCFLRKKNGVYYWK